MKLKINRLLLSLWVPGLLLSWVAQAAGPGPEQEVRRGPLIQRIRLEGEIAARRSVGLHAPVVPGIDSLRITSMLDEGWRVDKGQVVVVFDSEDAVRRVQEAEDILRLARAELAKLEQELATKRLDLSLKVKRCGFEVDRAKLLTIKGVGLASALQVERARLDLESARLKHKLSRSANQAAVRRADAELEVARLKVEAAEQKAAIRRRALSSLALTSPFAGLVARPAVRVTRGSRPSVRPGDRLLEVIDPARLEARFRVEPGRMGSLREGDDLEIRLVAFADLVIRGRTVRLEAPGPDGEDGWHLVVDLKSGDARLAPGMTAHTDLPVVVAPDVLSVPRQAILEQDGKTFVRLKGKNGGILREVKTGRTAGDVMEILDGLKAGEILLDDNPDGIPTPRTKHPQANTPM